ncbi:TPA: hypothetical protein ACKR4E_006682, partial [Pseudomonas aeruginosa]
SAPNTLSRSSNSLYWLMPAGSFAFNKKWSFDFWDAFYYYSNFLKSNNYEWEAEHGVTYKYSDTITAKLTLWGGAAIEPTQWKYPKDGHVFNPVINL